MVRPLSSFAAASRRRRAALCRLTSLLGFCVLVLMGDPAFAQEGGGADSRDPGSVVGRVLDRGTERGVADATVEIMAIGAREVTSPQGIFRFEDLAPGTYDLRIRHLAYGVFSDTFSIEPGQSLALRIRIDQEAIALDPLVVAARSEEAQSLRTRGTQANVITAEEIERAIPAIAHVGDLLTTHIPGIRIQEDPLQAGVPYCVEFRGKRSVQDARACGYPMVYMDGVRLYDLQRLWQYTELSDLHRVEVVPPSEAGVLYGTGSSNGVILIETKLYAEDPEEIPSSLRASAVYDWSLETEAYSSWKVFGAAFLGNALGLAAGLGIASSCIDFENLDRNAFDSSCTSWESAGARMAAVGFPILGTTLAAQVVGSTDLSRGKLWYQVGGAAVALIPGYALAATQVEGGMSTSWLGNAIILLGVPAAVTVADKLFRAIR